MIQEQWLPISEALDVLIKGNLSSDESKSMILKMLSDGSLMSKTNGKSYYFREVYHDSFESNPLNNILRLIPVEFWKECINPAATQIFDWKLGNFQFDGRKQMSSITYQGRAFDVCVDPTVITSILRKTLNKGQMQLQRGAAEEASIRGRKPASWWPDFAVELAVFIFENGLPDGDENEGQGALIKGVFDGMAERGSPEPSRTQIQPVINAVLARLRSAGN